MDSTQSCNSSACATELINLLSKILTPLRTAYAKLSNRQNHHKELFSTFLEELAEAIVIMHPHLSMTPPSTSRPNGQTIIKREDTIHAQDAGPSFTFYMITTPKALVA